jgi:hypothetical protein
MASPFESYTFWLDLTPLSQLAVEEILPMRVTVTPEQIQSAFEDVKDARRSR